MKTTFLMIAALTLAACGGGAADALHSEPVPPSSDSSIIPGAIAQAVKAGVIPALDFGTSLLGVDADGNGVRDDIDAYINSLPDTPEQKAALRQDSASMNAAMVVDVTNPVALAAAATGIAKASVCSVERYYGSPAEIHSNSITKYTINTPQRFDAWMRFNQAMSGSVTQMPKRGQGCAE